MSTTARNFAVPPPGKRAWLALALIFLLVISLPLIAAQFGANHGEAALPLPALLTMVLIGFVMLALGLAMRWRHVRVDSGEIDIRAAMYRQRVPLSLVDIDKARVVSLDEVIELRPRIKTNGYALPGFHAGHFRLKGSKSAFCLITDPRRVLMLPERGGRLLLISLERPHELLQALKDTIDRKQR